MVNVMETLLVHNHGKRVTFQCSLYNQPNSMKFLYSLITGYGL